MRIVEELRVTRNNLVENYAKVKDAANSTINRAKEIVDNLEEKENELEDTLRDLDRKLREFI